MRLDHLLSKEDLLKRLTVEVLFSFDGLIIIKTFFISCEIKVVFVL